MCRVFWLLILVTISTSALATNVNKIKAIEKQSSFVIADHHFSTTIFIDKQTDPLILWAVEQLITDIKNITGKTISLKKTTDMAADKGIFIGQFSDGIFRQHPQSNSGLNDAWEHFIITQHQQQLWVVGSDVRGTVYGIFELAERLGISPWGWWADVEPISKKELIITLPESGISESPSVQYRGIFLNDEDWGLQPWAAKTFEPQVGDIGPQTYEKIFQLLLRLKANTIWPAMHPSTQGFYTLPGNQLMAQQYHIVVGTSHAEPMLRNNVDEWDKTTLGDYNYFTNSSTINTYWQQRVNEVSSSGNQNIFTLGMRGVHDSHMQGSASAEQSINMLEQIIQTQRNMLSKILSKPLTAIPQVLIPYKEVLELYNQGLTIPDDVTLMWTDDNYGYIRRLSNLQEQQRAGGSGVYYHLSYWGRPHDYLWLSTTQPGLIWYEMSRAYANGAHKMWIANVGDIKPTEYTMELFLDLAWDVDSIKDVNQHLTHWTAREFGQQVSAEVAETLSEYYRLAMLRKPEFMGWSQTEPTTQTQLSEFTDIEAQVRIQQYQQLVINIDRLKQQIPKQRLAAWFQLVEYPVKAAANMNYKFLYQQLSSHANELVSQQQYRILAQNAYKQMVTLTHYYNNKLSEGKWQHMMLMAPRQLPVFKKTQFVLPVGQTEGANDSLSSPLAENRIEVQAYQFSQQSKHQQQQWQAIQGLGFSHQAMTLTPFTNVQFEQSTKPWLEYEVDIASAGEYQLEIRLLPTHSNNFDHQLEVQLDGVSVAIENVNTRGRSEEWKTNVLRNAQAKLFLLGQLATGKHQIRLMVNQTGMVIDQLALYPKEQTSRYQINGVN